MCDPLTIGGIALSAGSMIMNNKAASKVAKAREGVLAAERIRQKGFQQETDALNLASRERYNDFEGQQDSKSAALGDFFAKQNESAAAPAIAETIPTNGSNNVVVQEQAKQRGKAGAYSKQQAESMGALRAFGDLLGGISRLQARDSAQVGSIGGMMKGSSAVVPYELEAANSKGSGLKTFADILGGLGQVGTAAGIGGGSIGNIFGTAAKTAPAAAVGGVGTGVSWANPGGLGSGIKWGF